jgi:hypothetical protein
MLLRRHPEAGKMGKFVLGLCVAIWLMVGCGAAACAAAARPDASFLRPEQTAPSGDDLAPLGWPDVSRIDPRLAFLGAGVLVGLVIASPGLELSEVLGIALGVIGSQYLYYSVAPRLPGNLRPNP